MVDNKSKTSLIRHTKRNISLMKINNIIQVSIVLIRNNNTKIFSFMCKLQDILFFIANYKIPKHNVTGWTFIKVLLSSTGKYMGTL